MLLVHVEERRKTKTSKNRKITNLNGAAKQHSEKINTTYPTMQRESQHLLIGHRTQYNTTTPTAKGIAKTNANKTKAPKQKKGKLKHSK